MINAVQGPSDTPLPIQKDCALSAITYMHTYEADFSIYDKDIFSTLIGQACWGGRVEMLNYLFIEKGFQNIIKSNECLIKTIIEVYLKIYHMFGVKCFAILLSYVLKKEEDISLMLKISKEGLQSLTGSQLKALYEGSISAYTDHEKFKSDVREARRHQISIKFFQDIISTKVPLDVANLIISYVDLVKYRKKWDYQINVNTSLLKKKDQIRLRGYPGFIKTIRLNTKHLTRYQLPNSAQHININTEKNESKENLTLLSS